MLVTLDDNVFTDCICPFLSGEIVDHILLLNKHYNRIVKADMVHLYNLYWEMDYDEYTNGQLRYKCLFKDGKQEGEQIGWHENGQLAYKLFYKDWKKEGEQLRWFENGQLNYKHFYKDGIIIE